MWVNLTLLLPCGRGKMSSEAPRQWVTRNARAGGTEEGSAACSVPRSPEVSLPASFESLQFYFLHASKNIFKNKVPLIFFPCEDILKWLEMAKIKGTEVQRQHGSMSSVHIYFAE